MTDKKRIAFYIGGLAMGGAERVMCSLAEYFCSIGYEVFMVTKLRDEKEYELSPGITRIIADIAPEEERSNRIYNLYARIKKLSNIWKEIKPNIIISFIRKNNLMALASTLGMNIPVVVSVRSEPARELAGRGMKLLSFGLFRRAAGIVLLTNEAKEFFPKFLQKKAVIMPNGISEGFLKELEKENSKLHCDKQILSVGRIDNNKNQKLLIDAFSLISDKHKDWNVVICGDGENRESLEEYVRQADLWERVIFAGSVTNVPEYMGRAKIFVLPSRIEGMPNALIEAMVMGMACISTDCPCGGPRDLINKKYTNGILVPVDDKQAMSEALEKLILSGELRFKMGVQASKLIDRVHPDKVNLMWKKYVENIIDKQY